MDFRERAVRQECNGESPGRNASPRESKGRSGVVQRPERPFDGVPVIPQPRMPVVNGDQAGGWQRTRE